MAWSSSLAAPTELDVSGYDHVEVATWSDQGQIVGTGIDYTTGATEGLAWAHATVAPHVLGRRSTTPMCGWPAR